MTKLKDLPLKIENYHVSYKRSHANELKHLEFDGETLTFKIDEVYIACKMSIEPWREMSSEIYMFQQLLREITHKVNQYINAEIEPRY